MAAPNRSETTTLYCAVLPFLLWFAWTERLTDIVLPRPHVWSLGCQPLCCPLPGGPSCTSYYYTPSKSMDCERVYAIAIELTSAGPGDSVADLGAGHGLFSRKLVERVGPTGRVIATDIARDAFESLQRLEEAMPQLETVLVSNPNDTGLGAVADASLAAAWMMNSIVFDVEGTKARDVAWLRTLYGKLRPGGEVVYHLDWVDPQLHDLQEVVDRFQTAGFSTHYKLVDLPAEMPAETCVCVSRLFPVEAKKGFIAIFHRPK